MTAPRGAGLPRILIFTDGACAGNPGPGGYGVLLRTAEGTAELSGGMRRTTNNRMELLAAIRGLEALPQPSAVDLYSDSRYLVDGITRGWARRWKANGWRLAAGAPALNADLWSRLLELCATHRVTFLWVRGHSGHPENERCDALAVAASRRPDLPADVPYEGAGRRPLPLPFHQSLA